MSQPVRRVVLDRSALRAHDRWLAAGKSGTPELAGPYAILDPVDVTVEQIESSWRSR